ncbi:hypothetical protein BJ875DRAFT_40490 [Amylocarpus encephaloides]|uniref:Uncharacterized protein n=1 Tax=Amylocarpus encephaloides TaxID=45428 RepID=A0A9P7YR83_9HELO|nr:hypothetical protein BJ875DRAFT_40490 [Amylocarpus encephaloides]
MTQEIREIREIRPQSEQISAPIPSRSWDRHRSIDRHQGGVGRTLSNVSYNVSPISTPITTGIPPLSLEIPPLPPAKEPEQLPSVIESQEPPVDREPQQYRPLRPSRHLQTQESYEVRGEARVVSLAPLDPTTTRKPVSVTIRSRTTTPTLIPPPNERQNVVSTDTLGNHVQIRGGWRRPSDVIIREFSRWSKVINAVLSLVIPILLLALAIGLASLNGKPTGDRKHWTSYQDLMRIAGTFFPIVFAFLVGRAALQTATYLLERGTTLERLEQLVGSRTFCGAIATQVQIRSFNILGLGLVAVFILSPIGSQGYLRLLSPSVSSKSSPQTMPYFTTDTQSLFAQSNVASSDILQSSILRSLYIGALLSPSNIKASPMDLWTNVKIPYLSSLSESNTSDSSAWVSITPNDTVVYSSLVGLPIGGLQHGHTELQLESSYIELNCGSPVRQNSTWHFSPFQHDIDARSTPISPPRNGTYFGSGFNITDSSFNSTATWSIGLDNFISPLFNHTLSVNSPPPKFCVQPSTNSAQPTQPFLSAPCALANLSPNQVELGTLMFQSHSPSTADGFINQAFCQTRTIYVQSKVACTSAAHTPLSCRVTAQRPSQMSHAPTALTPLSFPAVFQPLSLYLPRSFRIQENSGNADPSLLYLTNPDPASLIDTNTGFVNLEGFSGEVLGRRLGQLINTYYTLSQGYSIIAQGNPVASSLMDYPTLIASVTLEAEFYKVSWGWFTFVFLALLVMTVATVSGSVLDHRTRNPEVLGWVSGLLRDSKFVEVEGTGGAVRAAEVSRKNKDLRLRMGGFNGGQAGNLVIAKEIDVVETRRTGLP